MIALLEVCGAGGSLFLAPMLSGIVLTVTPLAHKILF